MKNGQRTKQAFKALATFARKQLGLSDIKRWANYGELSSSWDSRTIQIAKHIRPNSHVLEFGAGNEVLRHFLPESCTYLPSDIVRRSANTLICDLNKDDLPDLNYVDVVVFSGVLEYVNNVPRIILALSRQIPVILASYAVLELNASHRLRHGWVNSFTTKKFLRLFEDCSYQCELMEDWNTQRIFKFKSCTATGSDVSSYL